MTDTILWPNLAKFLRDCPEIKVEIITGVAVPGIVQCITDVLFRDLWLRPDLAPRDRSLVTVSALIATGQVAQIPYHLNRAMDNGLTQLQATEVITHLAFYVGWPNAFSALPVAKDVFEKVLLGLELVCHGESRRGEQCLTLSSSSI